MKAKRRQELKTNDLAQVIDDVSQFLRKWATHLVAGVGAVLVILIIVAYLRSTKSSALDAAFAEMNSALQVAPSGARRSDDEIKRGIQRAFAVADEADDAQFKCDALMQGANLAISLATREQEMNPAFLPEARQGFERIVNDHKDQALYYGRALYGLFQVEANEFAFDGDPAHREAAIRHLEAIKNDPRFDHTPFNTLAVNQLNAIDEVFSRIEFAPAPPAPTTTAPASAPATAPAATTVPAATFEAQTLPAAQDQSEQTSPPEGSAESPPPQVVEPPDESEAESTEEAPDADEAAAPIP